MLLMTLLGVRTIELPCYKRRGDSTYYYTYGVTGEWWAIERGKRVRWEWLPAEEGDVIPTAAHFWSEDSLDTVVSFHFRTCPMEIWHWDSLELELWGWADTIQITISLALEYDTSFPRTFIETFSLKGDTLRLKLCLEDVPPDLLGAPTTGRNWDPGVPRPFGIGLLVSGATFDFYISNVRLLGKKEK